MKRNCKLLRKEEYKMSDIAQIILSIIGAIGGWEAIKYLINRKSNKRKEEAEADSVEFAVLRDTMVFLQEQLNEKEQRFAEQTSILRNTQSEVLDLTKNKGELELELQRYRCVVPKCASRQPQNGY